MFTRVRAKMRTVEERHRDNAGSRSLFASTFDESECQPLLFSWLLSAKHV